MIRSVSQVVVRYAETDMMGIVYHANYLPWLEIGRTNLLKELGVSYRTLEEEGFKLPVLEIAMKYFRPAKYDDVVDVFTTLEDKPLLRIRLSYEVKRGEELLATANSVHAFLDKDNRPSRPPPWAAERIAKGFSGS